LSRNIPKFDEIWRLCGRNHHKIYIVNLNKLFDPSLNEDYISLQEKILFAQRESFEMGRRISRTAEFKRSREPVWGKIRNERDQIVDNIQEQQISRLICMLGTGGSSVSDISNLIESLGNVNKEPFSLVEYSRSSCEDINVESLPYGMDPKNIADTLKYYEIRHRKRLNWKPEEIIDILQNRPNSPTRGYNISVDSLVNDFELLSKREETKEETRCKKNQEWIHIWYDPAVGLPPNIRLPSGMSLPTCPCELYIPKM
jgi:hypothetical protein